MKTISNQIHLQYTDDSTELVLSIQMSRKEAQQSIAELKEVLAKGKTLSVEIKPYRAHRSLDANSLCWVLCQKIAEVIGSTKELIYQEMIRRVGQFEIVPIKDEAVERWIEVWKGKGLGWYSEVLEDSKLAGYKKVIAYYGSSVYNVHEMSVLLNEIVGQCHELDIETMSPQEIKRLQEAWTGSTS